MATLEAMLLAQAPAPPEHRRVLLSVHHGHALQTAVLETQDVPGREILERAAAEVVYRHLLESPRWSDHGVPERLHEVAELFRVAGLGTLDVSRATASKAEVGVTGAPLAAGREESATTEPVCALTTGFLTGALAAVFECGVRVLETACAAQGSPSCRFSVQRSAGAPDLLDDPYPVPDVPPPPFAVPHAVDEHEVLGELFAGSLASDADGRIEALGLRFTHLWADLYAKVAYRFEREVPRRRGSKFANLPAVQLAEVGHRSAFHTLGAVLRSHAWRQGVAPLLQEPTDTVHALLAVATALGWGTWRIQSLVPGERLLVRVYDSYEAVGYRRHFGRAGDSKCYLARSTAAAVMNLAYLGDFADGKELTPSYYNQLFRTPFSFRALETRCRAGDSHFCEFVVNPLSPTLSSRGLGR